MSVKYKIFGNIYYQILLEELPFKSPYYSKGECDTIAIYNDELVVIRDSEFFTKQIFSFKDIISELEVSKEKKWVNNNVKTIVVNYYENLIKLLISYQRDLNIDKIVNKYDENHMMLAC